MTNDRIKYLVRNYAANLATGEEVEELFEWLRLHSEDEAIHSELAEMAATTAPNQHYDPSYWEPFITKVLEEREKTPQPVVHRVHLLRRAWFRYAAAAVFIIAVGILAVVKYADRQQPKRVVAIVKIDDVLPGRERAVLTLANGKAIILDSAQGNIMKQGDLTVNNLNGKLGYEGKDKEVQYHTLSTPKGGQYKLRLPDGTDVWLNAASSITYPTAFTGNDRKVTVTGEVYFEVAKDKTKPFKVNVDNKSEVEVLGTHFNINSYGDDGSIKTTLLEGSVKVSSGIPDKSGQAGNRESAILKPGEQVSLSQPSQLSHPIPVQTDEVMAWKNGLFNFNQADLKMVMAQLSRWYDIDVKYEGDIPAHTFRGKITRDLKLSQVVKILEDVGVKFKIEGRTLVVMP
jgi:ferric-dicitrate binding protein FerR (iron transport regulator)